jgi:hypothetical protein
MRLGRGMATRTRQRPAAPPPSAVVGSLKPVEAQQVLHQMLSRRPELVAEADEAATALLRAVTFQAVADAVQRVFSNLDWDDAPRKSTPWRDEEPVETVWATLDLTLNRFINDLKRYVDLGLEPEALEVCKGLLLGLYRLRECANTHELLAHAPDFLPEAAEAVLSAWEAPVRAPDGRRRRRKRPDFPDVFARRYLQEWHGIVV